jgi:5'(3')-deoxyribonucleotidase|tara:strand:+ start:958 stop:2799 length:1842 start_codon:yes stop_codon:yes gene_type:complete
MRGYNFISKANEAVGRITKQNQTHDVGPNEIKTQAKKFGNSVDKDGRPPVLHSKAKKNTKPNTLFNLGMAEGKSEPAKPRDPSFQTMVNIRKSGAGGAHRDKKKEFKQGKEKHKKNYGRTDEVTAKDISKESEIYVDMDGVLADFFGAWKKLIGKDWREIKDLPGALQKIRDKDDFWLNIPMTKNANNLLGLIKELKGSYTILSAPLPDDPNSEPHKREWIKKNLTAFPPKKVIITSNKAVHATQPDGTANILIDDYGQNVAKWESAGGVGFKHKDHKFERTVSNLKQHMSEADMSKSSIKKIHKTADKIKDKPKAKKSIGKWAKDRGMDPEGAIYAIATNMRKRKEGKKIDPPGRESYSRNELPQIKEKHLQKLPHTMETIAIKDIVPVQKERIKENHKRQLYKVLEGKFNPIVVDCHNRIVNGHHRYDIIKMLQMESITVAKLPFTLEYILEVTSEGNLLPNPQRSTLVKRDDAYDWYKIGTHMANIKSMPKDVQKRNKPDIFIQFYGGDKEKNYMMKQLKRIGYQVQPADGYVDNHFDEDIEGSYVLRISLENFADGKKKGRKGLSKRVGIPKGASVTQLRKIAKNSTGERRRMAHWQANMKSGRKKKGK